jgi:hypothetical protein
MSALHGLASEMAVVVLAATGALAVQEPTFTVAGRQEVQEQVMGAITAVVVVV